jgi:hypothetical protein
MKKKKKVARRKKKFFNVFYVPTPAEHELVVEAYTLEEAVKKVKDIIANHCEYVKGGWEVRPNEDDFSLERKNK